MSGGSWDPGRSAAIAGNTRKNNKPFNLINASAIGRYHVQPGKIRHAAKRSTFSYVRREVSGNREPLGFRKLPRPLGKGPLTRVFRRQLFEYNSRYCGLTTFSSWRVTSRIIDGTSE